jgi:hypothetical protein
VEGKGLRYALKNRRSTLISDARLAKASPVLENCIRRIFFINFVDLIFTTSIEAVFTNVFDQKTKTRSIACLCRARNAD